MRFAGCIRPFCFAVLLLARTLVSAQPEAPFDTSSDVVGYAGANRWITPVNQILRPAGLFVALAGMRPQAIALSPDARLLVTSGLTNELLALDPATGTILQHVRFPSDKAQAAQPLADVVLDPNEKAQLSFTGLKFSSDGSRIFLSNVNGDLKVFAAGKDQKIAPLFSVPLPPANATGHTNEIPTGIAVSPDGKKIYVALNLANRLAEIEAATGKVLRSWDVGVAPFDVALVGRKIYVSNWGGRRPDTESVTGPAGRGTLVRVDAHGVASEGSVSVVDLDAQTESQKSKVEILTGRHAGALAVTPDGKFLVVANAGSDTLSVIDTRSDKVVETICARQNPGDLFGAQPDALAFDKSGKKLFVCNASQNAVAVFAFKPGKSRLLGLIPVGWFPGAIAFDAKRKTLCVANIKSIATGIEKAKSAKGFGFNTHQYAGSISIVPVPEAGALAALTQTALANLRYPLLAQSRLPARPNQPARPVPERVGEPSVFRHVIYVIKENRAYDQVLGDVKAGNGDADLCIFGERVTPNQHKLVREFTLLDNTYCSGILSADGHNWTDTGMATDYLEREFAGWPRSYPSGGGGGAADSLAYSPAGFIWNDALEHGRSVGVFGEFCGSNNHWKDATRKGPFTFLDSYRDFLSGTDEIVYSCKPDLAALSPCFITNYPAWDLNVPDQVRAKIFTSKLREFECADNLPDLTVIWLPDDHTSGAKPGAPKPEAQVADNDLAMGKIVDAVSRSKFWTNTCIFAVEDDPQNGWDHVSGYRTTAYVISAFTKRGAVVSTQYNQTSLLRTIELILGLPPMNQMDATATPMFDCFMDRPDFTPFNSVPNQVPLDELNPPPKKIADTELRKDAYVSAKLPLEKPDQCPEDLLNRILWRSLKGAQAPYPEWAAKSEDDD